MQSEASHQVCWFFGFLGDAPVHAKFSCCLCPTQGHVVEITKWFAASICVCWAWRWLVVVMLWTEACCHKCQTWGHLARDTGHNKVSHCSFEICIPLRHFRKVLCVSQADHLCGLVPKIVQVEHMNCIWQCLKNHQGREKGVLTKFMETQIWCLPLPAGYLAGRVQKQQQQQQQKWYLLEL